MPQKPEVPAKEAKPAECEADCPQHRPVQPSCAELRKRVVKVDFGATPELRQ